MLLGAHDQTPAVVATAPDLTIDARIAADPSTVRSVVELEISNARSSCRHGTPATEAPEGRCQLGILWLFENFSRRQGLMSADLFVASRLGRWYLAELHIGGRLGGDQALSGERLTTRTAAVAAAAGANLWSKRRVFGGALVLRAQGYLVQFCVGSSGEGRSEVTNLGALALALEPRFVVSLTRRFSLQASAAAGLVSRGIVVRIQGVGTQSMSGVAVSATLAGVFKS